VLKKSEKGLLTAYQRSFSFWKKSFATGRCFTDGKILIFVLSRITHKNQLFSLFRPKLEIKSAVSFGAMYFAALTDAPSDAHAR
jgi:hypothetical protein